MVYRQQLTITYYEIQPIQISNADLCSSWWIPWWLCLGV